MTIITGNVSIPDFKGFDLYLSLGGFEMDIEISFDAKSGYYTSNGNKLGLSLLRQLGSLAITLMILGK